jgi:ribonucleoside-diphosphate reductase alpha chain
MCRLHYGSEAAAIQAGRWQRAVTRAAYLASINLAIEKGPFPLFDRDAYLAGETIRGLDEDIRAGIGEHGIRNALLTSIAPTGTISLLAGNVSSGIEPIFAHSYTRKIRQQDGSVAEEEITDYAVRVYRDRFGETAPLPDYFATAQTLTPADHIRMQAAVQRHVDSAVSKTVNCPADISFEAFKDIYRSAYQSGCKGCTTYRPNDITGSVLEISAPAEPEPTFVVASTPALDPEPLMRSEKLTGATYKLRWPASEHAFYVTINDIEIEGRRRPRRPLFRAKADVRTFRSRRRSIRRFRCERRRFSRPCLRFSAYTSSSRRGGARIDDPG